MPLLVLGLHANDDALERFEREHRGHGSRNGSDKIGTHAAVEGSPAFFVQDESTGFEHTLVARLVDHSVRAGNASLLSLQASTEDFVGVCGSCSADFANTGGSEHTNRVGTLARRSSTHLDSGKFEFQELI